MRFMQFRHFGYMYSNGVDYYFIASSILKYYVIMRAGFEEGKTAEQIKFNPDNFRKLKNEANCETWKD